MEVQIISKEVIKPSSATPNSLRTFKLSLLDQLATPMYVPIVLFYSPSDEDFCKISEHLKKSFSQALTRFYPFAGRMRDDYVIECDDDGAAFVEASVAGNITDVLQQADMNQLRQLLPFDPNDKSLVQSTDKVMLGVQVNGFSCGGCAIGVCIWHAVADASTLATFVTSWAAIASGSDNNTGDGGEIIDCTTLFPPQELSISSLRSFLDEDDLSEIVMKKFSFDGVKIVALREEIGNIGQDLDRPSRFESLSALILKAMIAVSGENEATKINAAAMAVNLRWRLEPPPLQKSIGNIYQSAMVVNSPESESGHELNYTGLAEKIRESVRKMNNEYIRKLHVGGAYFNYFKKASEMAGSGPKLNVTGVSSWCRFPFYEADFGWGKPIWSCPAMKRNRLVIFMDTRDGDGLEAWIGLTQQEMVKLEQDSGIVAYASFNPSL